MALDTSPLELDPAVCYRALRTRDPRFDGRFFTAVVSTGIYCRPVCPAPTPRRENCRFFACAAAAQEAGFRPCLRCRPETSPGSPAWHGTSGTVSRALRLIAEGSLADGSVGGLSTRLGVSDRHLRRLFLRHLGTSPSAVAQTRRILFAKRLIDETRLPMAEVALASGFHSIRRFNHSLLATYGRSPGRLRNAPAAVSGSGAGERCAASPEPGIVLRLAYRPPYAWSALHRFLGRRAAPGVEATGPGFYRRAVCLEGSRGVVEVRPLAEENSLVASIRMSNVPPLIRVVERLRRMFDLDADPEAIGRHLARDERLARRVAATPGLRIPGAWDGFELAVRAILGQQVSVAAATTLAGRLVEAYGERVPGAVGDTRFLFPRAETLADADLARIGMPRARAQAIRALAGAVAAGQLSFDGARDLEETMRALVELPGVGEWTAQYVAMRALQEPDAFPASDLGVRHALARGGKPPTAAAAARRAEAWRPWRAYATLYLWNGGNSI